MDLVRQATDATLDGLRTLEIPTAGETLSLFRGDARLAGFSFERGPRALAATIYPGEPLARSRYRARIA